MTDRELIELAARAAGICGSWFEIDKEFKLDSPIKADGVNRYLWRPHQDDGDALRLAISLGIVIDPSDIKKGRSAYVSYPLGGKYYPMTNMEVVDEEYAMRRLIVRAAAEIGKTMEKSQ